ncbi:MAG: FAD-binding protein [Firmicutes bacterium]|nr:FAD-binding protein [Bacillota bacterium]
MKEVLIIGSGIAGMTCAIECAKEGVHCTLVSPFPSERSQSVMAAGGINGVTADCEEGDSVNSHIEDTLKGGAYIAGRNAVTGLCEGAGEIIDYLESIGTVFSVDGEGRPMRRAFGGQSHKRTYFCRSATGKLIVSSLVMEARRFEAAGLITRKLRGCFHSALIKDGKCCGALIFDEATWNLEAFYADALVIATGGQNSLFGKTTGSTQCDGYAAGMLFLQGAELKNLEFIQYHPTTIETDQKRMLISEAVRGEGGRLFYEEDGKRVYFMEDKYGPKGNLMTRDVISREMYLTGRDIYLDISFLDEKTIMERLPEVAELCMKYRGIDITKEPIPVAPSVHFFMGGLAVHLNHETNIKNLFAIGECASIYHGANRLGGNSLLAALYGGKTAAKEICGRESEAERPDFKEYIEAARAELQSIFESQSRFPSGYLTDMVSDTIKKSLGIVRNEEDLKKGIEDIDYYISISDALRYDSSVLPYFNYKVRGILALAKACLSCALARQESRGSHVRSDYPDTDDSMRCASVISYDNGNYTVRFDKEGSYES